MVVNRSLNLAQVPRTLWP